MKHPTIYPRLIQGELVEIGGERYRVEFWSDRTYEFKYLGENGKENFKRTEKQVSQAIKNNQIQRL